MIIARGEGAKGPFLLMGLSDGNIEKLQEGMPIYKPKEQTGIHVDIIIVHGETEDAILKQLSSHFSMEAPDES